MASAKKNFLAIAAVIVLLGVVLWGLYLLSRNGVEAVPLTATTESAEAASLASLGEGIAAPAAAHRLVSVGGAATEIIYALGAGDNIVGVDQSSVFPEAAQALPQVGYVRTVSAEGVLALSPTQIIAGHEIGPVNAVTQIQNSGLPVLIINKIDKADDLYSAIVQVGEAVGHQEQAQALIASIKETFAKVEAPAREPLVVFMMKPPSSMRLSAAGKGTRAQDLIELAGGRNAVTNFTGYKALSQEALMTLQPDVIVVASAETLEKEGTAEEIITELLAQPAWGELRAAKNGHVYAMGLGEALSFGPRMGDVVLRMNGILREAAELEPASGQ